MQLNFGCDMAAQKFRGSSMQNTLSDEQVAAFHHDFFVIDQVRDFVEMIPMLPPGKVVVDVGGGCGFFARRLMQQRGIVARVIDMDQASIVACQRNGVDAALGNALSPPVNGDEGMACFNLILHHLVADTEAMTRELQSSALSKWRDSVSAIFVNEYIYESYIASASGWLIYQITSNKILSSLGKQVAKIFPALRANTFGVGVRFRSHAEWIRLFAESGYECVDCRMGKAERVALPLRGLLIKTIRRDSFLLRPIQTA